MLLLHYEEYKYLEDKTNSEMYPSSNKREFDTLLRKNIRWYLDSTIKDNEKRINYTSRSKISNFRNI